ncbi:M81 family metallopeptidase [Paracoccus siganidrum]|uniref:Microcystinase C n=1 Tax=Paracoccus siganidrum TaxID=1276757 RepID=A0A419A688_9RHOB|nr:M81 family metallopeptidase [Paracoccus siganidrum]RJL12564.1 M81 family peptidase [Paracoccus siganidrum]RMC37086.1 microcystin degradation protein MlrC [Paracoccus siganidrum]
MAGESLEIAGRGLRVALAGFVHESNSFAPSPADLAAFAHGGGYLPLSRGDQIMARARDVNLPIAGAIAHGRAAGWRMEPLLWAGAVPSAPVTAECYGAITDEIIDRLRAAGPLDGVFLDLHGAMVAEGAPDGEGPLIARVRQVVGPGVPIVAALDLHGNITPLMVEQADALVGFLTYPHVDMAETGQRAAAQLDRLMAGEPCFKAFRQLDFLIPIAWQSTLGQPGARLYALAAEPAPDLQTASLFMGFPAADFADCGPSVVAYGRRQQAADAAADRIAAAVTAAEPEFAGRSFLPEEGVREAMRLAGTAGGPVILADTQDNPGAGGNSDTTGMLRALVACDAQRAAIGLIADPQAAAAAHAAGAGAEIEIALGGRSGIPGDAPFRARFTVETLSDGACHATGGYYGGAHLRLGPSACLRIGGVRIAVTSEKAQMADRQMFGFLGIRPEEQAILVVKSSVHFRADFSDIAQTILTCLAPGPMPVSPAGLPWRHLRPGIRLQPGGPPFNPTPQN